MRRLFSLVVLVALVVAVVYVLQKRGASAPGLAAEARSLGAEARSLGAEAKEKLGAAGHELEDTKITASVKAALEVNRSLRPYSFKVSTDARVVTLRGSVDGDALRKRAEAVAARVPDVARVVNEISATRGAGSPETDNGRSIGEKLDDRTLEVRVKLALSLNRDLKDSNVGVKAYRHDVTLTGDVTNPAQHALALETVTETDGVEHVVDQLQVTAR